MLPRKSSLSGAAAVRSSAQDPFPLIGGRQPLLIQALFDFQLPLIVNQHGLSGDVQQAQHRLRPGP